MLGNSKGLGNRGKGGQVQVRRCDGGVGGVRGDHSRYSEVSCACVCVYLKDKTECFYLAQSVA